MKTLRCFAHPLRAALLLLALLLWGEESAQAGLMLYPTRVVLENKERSAQVEIINNGDRAETYRINLINRRMTGTGEIVVAESAQPGELFADQLVRYSPRQVTLQPGKAQTVRIQVRKPKGLAAGEYRTHLQFDQVADIEGESNIETLTKAGKGEISIALKALVGASIPVIVRHGETQATATLSELALESSAEKKPLLAFAIKRAGNASTYGDLVATFTPEGGSPLEIGKASGVAVYVPNSERKSKLPLTLPEGIDLKRGSLSLSYLERPDAGGRMIATTKITLP